MKIERLEDEAPANKVNMLLYGEPGVGKTVFAGTAPRPLILNFDAGLMSLYGTNPDVQVVRNAEVSDVSDIILMSRKGELKDVDTIVIDSITHFMKKLQDHYRQGESMNISLKDWGVIIARTEKMLRALIELPQNILITALTQEDAIEERLYKRPSLSGKKLPEEITAYMDIVGYMYAWEREGEIQRKIFVQPHEKFYAKDRTGALPISIDPNFTEMLDKIRDHLVHIAPQEEEIVEEEAAKEQEKPDEKPKKSAKKSKKTTKKK